MGWMSVLPVRAKENSPRIYPWVAKCVGNKSRQGRQNPVLFSGFSLCLLRGLGDFRIRLPTVETVGYFRVSLRDEDERRRGEMSDGLPKGWASTRVRELFASHGGGTPNRATPAYWNGNIPWLSSGDIKTTSISESSEPITRGAVRFIGEKETFVSREKYQTLKKHRWVGETLSLRRSSPKKCGLACFQSRPPRPLQKLTASACDRSRSWLIGSIWFFNSSARNLTTRSSKMFMV